MQSTVREDLSRIEDNEPARERGRAELVRDIIIPVAHQFHQAFEIFHMPDEACLKKLMWRYKAWRDTAERGMTGPGVSGKTGHLLRIDRHKIAAAFLLAILDARPLKLKRGHSITRKGEALVNHSLAFRVAVRILRTYAIHEARVQNDSTALRRWEKFCFPRTRDNLDYREHAALAVFHAEQNNALNLPVVANWLFVLEQHHSAVSAQI